MDTTACEVCGGAARRWMQITNRDGEPAEMTFVQCRDCRQLFASPKPTDEQLTRVYEALDAPGYNAAVGTRRALAFQRAVEDLAPLLSGGAAALIDIGCGNGKFLEELRKRFVETRLIGQEIDARCVEICREKGFETTLDGLSAVSAGSIDVAVMLDVAEHVRDPATLLSGARKLLRPGGTLYIHTPRRSFWDSLFLGLVRVPVVGRLAQAWLQSRISIYHLRLWSDRGLREALAHAGFRVVHYRSELELSWPFEMYFDHYLGRNLRLPKAIVRAATRLGDLLFLRLRLLRNKAIVTAVAV